MIIRTRTWGPLLCSLILLPWATAQNPPAAVNHQPAQRDSMLQAFAALQDQQLRVIKNRRLPLKAIAESRATVVVGSATAEAPSQPATGPAMPEMGLKVSVRLATAGQPPTPGAVIDHAVHRWKPHEQFFLQVESAVPVQLTLFSVSPQQQPVAFSPDERFPETFATIMPGQPWLSPLIQLEDNLQPEMLALIAVRADRAILPINGGTVPAVINVTSTVRVLLQAGSAAGEEPPAAQQVDLDEKIIYRKTKQLTENFAKIIYSKTKDADMNRATAILKMQYAAPPADDQANRPEQPNTIALSAHPVGHLQLFFSKHGTHPPEH